MFFVYLSCLSLYQVTPEYLRRVRLSIDNVRDALNGILESWGVTNSIPIAWENLKAPSDFAAPYVAAFLLPVDTGVMGLAIGDNQDFTGIYQVSVYTEKGKGTKESSDIVNTLLEAFARGVTVMIGDQRILIEASWAPPAVDSEAWYTVPLSVRYRSFA